MAATRFILLRHGQTTWNLESRVQGQVMDVPLTALGKTHMREAATELAALVDHPVIFTSDQLRARQSAEIVGKTLGVVPIVTPLLREQDVGEMEGKLPHELEPQPVPPDQHISEICWAGGESVQQVWQRSMRFLELVPTGEPVIVVVGHGDALRTLAAAIEGRSHREVDYSRPLRNGQWWEVCAASNPET